MKNKGRKNKHKNRTSRKNNLNKPATSSSRVRKSFSFAWKGIVSLGVLLGVIMPLYGLFAIVEVSSSDIPINSHNPFTSPFNVKNNGILPFYNVHFNYQINDVSFSNGSRIINPLISKDMPFIKRIDARESTTTFIVFNEVFKTKDPTVTIKSADIEVVVIYKPAYLLWSKEKSFRFATVPESDSSLRWVPKALSE